MDTSGLFLSNKGTFKFLRLLHKKVLIIQKILAKVKNKKKITKKN